MDAKTWDTAVNPPFMLEAVRGRMSDRKFRLFAVACCRRRDDLIRDHRCREALRLVERMAEEKVPQKEIDVHRFYLEQVVHETLWNSDSRGASQDDSTFALALGYLLDGRSAFEAACQVANHLGRGRSAIRHQTDLLREVMGNPFRPVVAYPRWLDWERGLVRHLAQTAYDGRAFDRLPILGDALEDAGCDSAELLAHLRGGGPHVPGCWALDALLGKS
jgi:hypothetical protein